MTVRPSGQQAGSMQGTLGSHLQLPFMLSIYSKTCSITTGPWARLLDVSRTLTLPVVVDNSNQARWAGGVQAAAQRIRAQRAGSTQSTLGTLGTLSSLSATASLTDKLTSSQYALGESPL